MGAERVKEYSLGLWWGSRRGCVMLELRRSPAYTSRRKPPMTLLTVLSASGG
jgi:hypothetical protein